MATGDRSMDTGDRSTGDRSTGDRSTGDRSTGGSTRDPVPGPTRGRPARGCGPSIACGRLFTPAPSPGSMEVSMNQDELKKASAWAALAYVEGGIIGVGTGSTVNYFIDALATIKDRIEGAVSSSEASTTRLLHRGIPVYDLNEIIIERGGPAVYIDGTDEANPALQLIKGGGGALTREKIVASASRRFVCIADESKLVQVLGHFPLPVEVIPMAQSYVADRLTDLGGSPAGREGFLTDNGNVILDIRGLQIDDPLAWERRINDIPGVVTVGLFAIRPADILILGTSDGIRTLEPSK